MATRKKTKAKAKKARKKKTATRPKAARKRAVRKSAGGKSAAKKGRKAKPKKTGVGKAKPKVKAKAKAKSKTKARAALPRTVPVAKPIPSIPRPSAPASTSGGYGAPAATAVQERAIGTVTHYFSHLAVAIVKLDGGSLREGDVVRIKGHTSDFTQPVESMEIEHVRVSEAHPGQSVGIRVREHAREHDVVYKVERGSEAARSF